MTALCLHQSETMSSSSPRAAPSRIRKFTARDVAEQAGVSKATVLRAFDESASVAPDVRTRIRQIAAAMGYSPNLLARSLSTRSTRLIALVVDELGNPNQLRVLSEVTRQVQARGYSTLVLNISPEYGPAEALQLADQFQVDGIVFQGTTLNRDLIELARRVKHIPLVVMLRNSGEAEICHVSTDGYAAGGEIADLFLDQGYRRIGYMAGPLSERTELRRMEGFRDRLAARGVSLSTPLVAEHYRRTDGMRALSRYLEATPRSERLEALFCENDILAIGALDALVAGHLRHKMAIVGFDDIELGSSPSFELTTFRQPVEHLVHEALRRILDRDAQALGSVMVPGALVLRSSHRRSAD
jgi:DNA-binding LacI/PurR family transcriptional regulator